MMIVKDLQGMRTPLHRHTPISAVEISVACEAGFSLIEMLFTVSIIGILLSTSISNLMVLERPLVSAASNTAGFLKQARAKAVATTSAYRVFPSDTGTVNVQSGLNCDAAATDEQALNMELPSDVYFSDTDWEICFTPRGLADDNVVINLQDVGGQSKQVEIYVGGAIRLLN